MGIIRRCLLLISLLTPARAAFAADPLTLGSPAPALQLAAFLKGEPVKELRRGSVYAIEFSGTQCAPCVRAMPHLTELQKKRPEVILISVYSEKEEKVRAHFAQHDAEIGYRVALDDNGAMARSWQQASNVNGIPTVYVVGADGVLAWIGDPTDLDTVLGKLRDGKFDIRRERMRLAFGQADDGAFRAWEGRRESSEKQSSRLSALCEEGKWAEAVEGAERAAFDFPDDAFAFRSTKLYALASDPKTTDQALNFAAELSAMMTWSRLGDLGKDRLGTFDAEIAQSLLDGEKNADPLIAEAATILLSRSEKGLKLIKDDEERFDRSRYINQVLAMVDARRNDFASAADRMRRTLDQINRRQCPETSPEGREKWEKKLRWQTEEVESSLAEYVQAAEKAKSGK